MRTEADPPVWLIGWSEELSSYPPPMPSSRPTAACAWRRPSGLQLGVFAGTLPEQTGNRRVQSALSLSAVPSLSASSVKTIRMLVANSRQ